MENRDRSLLLLGVFLISFGALAFEISLTRLLSTVLTYHYVFAIASLALLGQGLGALAIYYKRREKTTDHSYLGSLGLYGAVGATGMILSVALIVAAAGGGTFSSFYFFAYWVAVIVPFACGGAALAEIFRLMPNLSGRLYGADLVGAALGCLAVVLVLNWVGAVTAVLIFAVAVALGGLFIYLAGGLGKERNSGRVITIALLVAVLLAVAGVSGVFLADIPVGANPDKEIHDSLYLYQGEIAETRWSAFGKTDLVRYRDLPHQMDIYLDGTAGTPMYKFSGNLSQPGQAVEELLDDFPGYFPFLFLKDGEKEKALIIGPGGGRDILMALAGGSSEITAVEVNPDLVNIVDEYNWFNGGLYEGLEEVEWVVAEGRSYILGRKDLYDLIMFSLPVTNTGRSREGLALTESFLFTTDAIGNYLDHLTEKGTLLVIAHNDAEILRLLSLVLKVFEQRGANTEKVMEQLYIIGADPYPVFVLRMYPFESTEIGPIYEEAVLKRRYNPMTSYFPHVREYGAANAMLMALGAGLVTPAEVIAMVKQAGYDISPVSDDNPFFYNLTVGVPISVNIVFWLSLAITAAAFFLPGLRVDHKQSAIKKRGNHKNPVAFSLLFLFMGIGFMLVEISLIQRFILFLGQPVLSLALLLFSILLGTGCGSLTSSRVQEKMLSRVRAGIVLSIVLVLVIYNYFLPQLFASLLGESLIMRGSIAFILLFPLGFLMGFPFPLSLREMKYRRMEMHIPWMWGLNGVSSVLGSVMATVLAIQLGFTAALYSGMICYFFIFLISIVFQEQ